jgi:hypothetical protein
LDLTFKRIHAYDIRELERLFLNQRSIRKLLIAQRKTEGEAVSTRLECIPQGVCRGPGPFQRPDM